MHNGSFTFSLLQTYFLDCQYVLDTSPDVPSTHWAQTVLFIDKTILLCNQATLLCNLEMIRLRDKQNSIQCNITMDYLGYPNYFFEKKYILSFYWKMASCLKVRLNVATWKMTFITNQRSFCMRWEICWTNFWTSFVSLNW